MKAIRFTLVVLLGLLATPVMLTATGRGIAGLSLGSFMDTDHPGLIIGYCFSARWSIDIVSSPGTDRFKRQYNEEEYMHYMETDDIDMIQTGIRKKNCFEFEISLRRWIDTPFKGPFVSGNLRLRQEDRPVLSSGAGYGFVIWKSLHCSITYALELIESSEERQGHGVSIQLYYTF